MTDYTARKCSVLAALDARKTAHYLRRAGFTDAAWRLVQIHLKASRAV